MDKGPENSCQRYTLPQLRRLLNQAPKDNNEQSLSNCYKTKLQISQTRKEDEKEYILVVKNKEGTFEHSIRLNVCVLKLKAKSKKKKNQKFIKIDLIWFLKFTP